MKRALLVLVAVVVVSVLATGTGASFTDAVTFDVDISTGSVALTADGPDLIFSSAPLAPGDVATASVRIRNDGSLPADVALHRAALASTAPAGCALRSALHLRIVEDADGDPATSADRAAVADAPLAGAAADLAIGTLAKGAARTYEVAVRYVPQGGTTAASNDNCFQGSVEQQRFSWTAVEDDR